MKTTITVLLIIFSTQYFANAQKKYARRLSLSEWVNEMINYKKETYVLKNAEIYFDFEKDTGYVHSSNSTKDSMKFLIDCYVEIENCKFPNSTFSLSNLSFKKQVLLTKNKIPTTFISHCEFDEGIEIIWGELGLIFFTNTTFGDVIQTYEAEISIVEFEKCIFNVSNKKVKSNISFNDASDGFKDIINIASPNASKKINILGMDSCTINAIDVIPVFYAVVNEFNSVRFSEVDFKNTILNFEVSSIEKAFMVEDCIFNQPIGMNGFNFPEKGTNFHWSQIEKAGIAIYSDRYKTAYTASTDSQLVDVNRYNELISAYKQLHSTYRTRGDMESANNCYIAMKDVETRRLSYLYHDSRSLNNYFNWKLNQFLKFFCKYGTSPIRALIISMWVILSFALIYFFFDSEWDKINREYILKKYKSLLAYFQSDKKLADYYAEKHNLELDTYNEFKEYLKSSQGNIPKYMIWLGKPLYRFSTTRRMLTSYIYSKVEILDGEWNALKPRKKAFVNTITVFTILFFMLYALLSKIINSLFLSINTFSTLGFGRIPVKGISRYLAILQGFLGWFLLSIFSVSLINQILQG